MNCTAVVVARDDLKNSKIVETQLPERTCRTTRYS